MPAYDYHCESCDMTFEVVRPASDRSEICCPECGLAARRIFTPVGVVFKGSGFHNTDYRSPSKVAERRGKESSTLEPVCGSSSACDSCPAAAKDE